MTDKKTIASKLDNVAERVESSEMKKKLLGTLADMLERKNIDINEIGDIKRVSLYQSMLKDDQGEAQIHDLAAVLHQTSSGKIQNHRAYRAQWFME